MARMQETRSKPLSERIQLLMNWLALAILIALGVVWDPGGVLPP